jgi:hypothetical protein
VAECLHLGFRFPERNIADTSTPAGTSRTNLATRQGLLPRSGATARGNGATDGVVCGTRQVAKQLLQSAVRAYKGTRGAAAGSGMLETVAVEAGAEGTQPSVVLVGDTHGQLHDLLHILSEAGACVKR